MAYDEELADRLRAIFSDSPGVTEKRMFGGLAFLVHGNMAIAASGQGGVLVRTSPENADRLVGRPGVEAAIMRGREMRGWLRVQADHLQTKQQLEEWARLGESFADSLPPKE